MVLFEEPSSSLPLLLLEPRSDLEAAPVEDLLDPPLPCVDECEEEVVERRTSSKRRRTRPAYCPRRTSRFARRFWRRCGR